MRDDKRFDGDRPLELTGVSKMFGGVAAVSDVDLVCEPASIVGLIGPNGSGKTTLLNVIAGTLKASSGTIRLGSRSIGGLRPHQVTRAGIARTFQTTRVMSGWTVRESLELASTAVGHRAPAIGMIAEIVGIEHRIGARVSSLTNAEQRLLMVASALCTGPQLVLLDEPAVGMDVGESDHLHRVVRRLVDELGAGVLIVEHNMRFLMSLVERVVVMDAGKVIAAGSPEAIRKDEAVIDAYLGRVR